MKLDTTVTFDFQEIGFTLGYPHKTLVSGELLKVLVPTVDDQAVGFKLSSRIRSMLELFKIETLGLAAPKDEFIFHFETKEKHRVVDKSVTVVVNPSFRVADDCAHCKHAHDTAILFDIKRNEHGRH